MFSVVDVVRIITLLTADRPDVDWIDAVTFGHLGRAEVHHTFAYIFLSLSLVILLMLPHKRQAWR